MTTSTSPTVGAIGPFLEVLRDDFSDPRSGFPTGDVATERVAYEDDALHLRLKQPGRAVWTMREFGDWPLAEVQASMSVLNTGESGFFGLTCGRSNDDYYAGVISSSGEVLVLRVIDRVATPLARVLAAVTAPVVGDPMALRLLCLGSDSGATAGVTLDIDGREVASAADATGFSGLLRAGFYAESASDSEQFDVSGDDIVVTVGVEAGPDAAPSPTTSLTGDAAADRLALHVPEPLRPTCRKATLSGFSPVVAVDCPSGSVTMAAYLEFASTAAMQAAYQTQVAAHPEATGASCQTGAAKGPYLVDSVPVGQVLCYGTTGAVSIVWTDERLDIMGMATFTGATYMTMYTWWLSAGPIT
ncbi:MAG: hypothetical protein ABIZ34_01210 [Candidatus Limnocylindrales bacterium]